MTRSTLERGLILFFRIAMGWTFLYAGWNQVLNPNFTVARLLGNAKTFHDLFAPLATPTYAPAITILVAWGHLLIGLSLVSGLLVRVSASVGVVLMVLYWMAFMDWPLIENPNNFILDFHLVYAGVLVLLVAARAGHVCGLDAWAQKHPALRSLAA